MKINRIEKARLFLCASLLLSVSVFAHGQQTKSVVVKPPAEIKTNAFEQTFQLKSRLMNRQMPYLVLLPNGYETSNEKTFYPVVYLLHGLTGHFDNWTDKTRLREFAKNYGYIIVTPEGDNGWYSDSATVEADKYESYIVEELMPEIEKNFRAKKTRDARAIAGLSMGGYGSIKFGLKYPEKFALVGSFSGALQAASLTDKLFGNGWKALTDSIMSVYGAENSPTRAANDIFAIARQTKPETIKNLPFIYLSCGTEDGLIGTNREFSNLLLEKKIAHEYRQSPGVHNWVFWNQQVEEFLRLSARFIK